MQRVVHPAAEGEVVEAFRWYLERSEETDQRFLDEPDSAFASTERTPLQARQHLAGTRRVLLPSFPYMVVYRVMSDRLWVLAVAHGRRRPGYWKSRLHD